MSDVEVTEVVQLIQLPVNSVLIGQDGTAWVRTKKAFQPWASVNRGGYGAFSEDLEEISGRLLENEGPFVLAWTP